RADADRPPLPVAATPETAHSGGVAFLSRSRRYESNILPAWGAPGVASSEAQFASKRGAFASATPSDSPGTLMCRKATTTGAGAAVGRSPSPAPLMLHQLAVEVRMYALPLRPVSITNALPVMPTPASACDRSAT